MKHKIKKIHFIGIGGVGMSGIAEVLHNLGYVVSGSDAGQSYNTDRLISLGMRVAICHAAENVQDVDVIVASTAIDKSNPEIVYGIANRIPIVPRAQMLAELMRFKYGIAIAGTHGKTTTTSLAAEVLKECKLDPTFVIGGKLATTGSNAKLGTGEYLVAEADESDASFLLLNPMISVITNIDLDHMDTYEHSEEKLKEAFIKFVSQLPFYGRAIVCAEDSRIVEILPRLNRPYTTYGLDARSDIYATNIVAQAGKMSFTVRLRNSDISYPITVNMPGIHNVLNSLAVIAVALECEGKFEDIARGLANFNGVGRRCQYYPDINHDGKVAKLIDDYGHHPVELKATISALKGAYPDKRMVLIFQPHRYTRTRDLFDEFVSILSKVDYLILTEVYAAGEKPLTMADGKSLVKAIRAQGHDNVIFVETLDEAKEKLFNVMLDGDLVVTMGAGSIGKLPAQLTSSN